MDDEVRARKLVNRTMPNVIVAKWRPYAEYPGDETRTVDVSAWKEEFVKNIAKAFGAIRREKSKR